MKSPIFFTLLFIATMCNATANPARNKKKNSPSASLWKKELKTDGKFLLGSALAMGGFGIGILGVNLIESFSKDKNSFVSKKPIYYPLRFALTCGGGFLLFTGIKLMDKAHHELIELDRLEEKEYGPTTSKTYRYIGNATIVGGALTLLLGYSALITAAMDYMQPEQISIPTIKTSRSNFLATRDHQIQTVLLLLAGPLLVRLGYKIKSWSKTETASTETISTSGQ